MYKIKKLVKCIIYDIFQNVFDFFYRGNKKIKQIAVTFDDGPNKKYTSQTLDILKKFNIKATFFLTAKEVLVSPELTERIINENHCIGNHTYSHTIAISYNHWIKEITEASSILKKYSKNISIFRPPQGKLSIFIYLAVRKLKYKIILWSIDSMDWKKSGKDIILKNVNVKNIKNGDIILFHDDNQYTIDVLPVILKQIKEAGYKFVTIDEMITH